MRHLRSDYVWEGGGMLRMPCLECKENFSTTRRDAKYCGDTCRKRANRRRKTILSDAENVAATIRRLKQMQIDRDDLQSELYQALKLIRDAATGTDGSDRVYS